MYDRVIAVLIGAIVLATIVACFVSARLGAFLEAVSNRPV